MTTFFDYAPSTQSVFQFNPTLDGQEYNAILPWGLFGQRPYLSVYALDGTLILNKALVGSPVGVAVETISWRLGVVTVTTETPHNYPIGFTIDLTVAGCAPDVFNGVQRCTITSPKTFTYPLTLDPGDLTAVGIVNYNINLVQGYFNSVLVFREANSQFEVSP